MRLLIGCEPSAALKRHAALVAEQFAALGLKVGIGDVSLAS